MSFLTIENISKSYFDKKVLDSVSFRLDKGERLALIGSNGTGKTTLLKLITGLEKPDSGRIIMPSGVIPGYLSQHVEDICDLDKTALHNQELTDLENQMREKEREISELANSIEICKNDEQLNTLKQQQNRLYAIYNNLTATFDSAGGYNFRHQMMDTLNGLGLDNDTFDRPMSQLSGGERMRVALARLLIKSPDLLLLDEPTNHMDAKAMEWLEQYLVSFKGAVLLISHDRMFIDKTATSVAELSQGAIRINPGNYSKFIELEQARQETLEKEIANLSKELKRQEQVTQTMLSHRNMSGYHAREKVSAKLSAKLSQIKTSAKKERNSLNFRFMPGNLDGAPDKELVSLKNVSISFSGDKNLFADASFVIRRGERYCLCGDNGCGKSTLLNLILGKTDLFDGEIHLSRQAVFGHMGQQIDFSDENASALNTLLVHSGIDEATARNLLARYGFRDVDVFKKVKILSGGERARLYLCCLLLEQPDMLFLDEPTNHLDINSREILEQALIGFDGSILSVSHDRYFIDKCADNILGFINGKIDSFDSFTNYRKKVKETEEKFINEDLIKKQSASEQAKVKELAGRINRAEERKNEAKRKQKIRDLEKEIAELEKEKTELENKFSQDNTPELYARYAVVLQKTEDIYEELFELSDT